MDLVCFESLGPNQNKFPEFIQSILAPSENVCSKRLTFGYDPIKIKRRDTDKEIIIDYLNNRQGNQKKIKFVARELRTYFERTTLDSVLTNTTRMNNAFEEYLNTNRNKENVFFYSESDELSDVDFTLYSSLPSLNEAIQKSICIDSSQKIIVVLVPSTYKSKPNIPEHDPAEDSYSMSISKVFKALSDKTESPEERINKIPNVLDSYFSTNATVEVFETNGTRMPSQSAAEYLESLVFLLSLDSIQIHQVFTDTEGKIYNIQITEHHKLVR